MLFQAIGEDYVTELSQLTKLNEFVDNAAFIRDVSKVKQVRSKYSFDISTNGGRNAVSKLPS